jgi:hypothetical protein
MKRGACMQTVGIILGAFIVVLGVYIFGIRPWHVHWGATKEDVARAMAGDDLVTLPGQRSTRAVTIAATPEQIWPWLLQMGFGRGGWYSIDAIDNGGKPSANSIIPELQNLKIGDKIALNQAVAYDVVLMEPDKAMVWQGGDVSSMSWGLYPIDAGHTRLVLREQGAYKWSQPWWIITDPGGFVMARQCLLGIKARAEQPHT